MPTAEDAAVPWRRAPSDARPGPERVSISAGLRDAIVAHARAEAPNEACGLIAGTAPAADGGIATAWHATRNRAASPLRYDIHPEDLLRVSLAIDDADGVIWGIVHSHVRSPAHPSPTDVGLALYPDAIYLIVSLAESEADAVTGAASLRAWRILGRGVFEVVLDVVDG